MRTVICIPTYNERENLPSLVGEILATVDADVMVLDDNSPDGTGHAADLLSEREARVKVVHRSRRTGLASAYIDGFQRALAQGYDYIFEMDADFSHQPRYLRPMFGALTQADVVVGSRHVDGGGIGNWGAGRRALSKAGNVYARRVLGVPCFDLTSGFVGFRRRVLENIHLSELSSRGYAFQIEMKVRAHRSGFSIQELPILFWDRVAGASKISRRGVYQALWSVHQMKIRRP